MMIIYSIYTGLQLTLLSGLPSTGVGVKTNIFFCS